MSVTNISEKERKEMMKKANKAAKPKMNVVMLVVFIVLAVYALSILFMLAWAFITTFRTGLQYTIDKMGFPKIYYFASGKRFEPSVSALYGYNYFRAFLAFEENATLNYSYTSIFGFINRPSNPSVSLIETIWNTFVYAIGGAFIHTFVQMIVAYICSKYKFRFLNILLVINLIVMTIPIIGSQPAKISFMQKFALFDSIPGMLINSMSFTGIYLFVFKSYFDGVGDSYGEAAEIDGATQLSTFFMVYFPLAIKLFSTVFMLTFIQLWNDYQTPLLYFPTHMTLAYAVYNVALSKTLVMAGNNGDKWAAPQKIAACMILAIPMIIVFIAFNKKIMGDISMGGLKE